MILKIRFVDTLHCIAEMASADAADKEANALLDLLVISVFSDHVYYKEKNVEEKINRLINTMSISPECLEEITLSLFSEMAEHFSIFAIPQPASTYKSPCVYKTSKATYCLLTNQVLIKMPRIEH
jgi:hypothetical protein